MRSAFEYESLGHDRPIAFLVLKSGCVTELLKSLSRGFCNSSFLAPPFKSAFELIKVKLESQEKSDDVDEEALLRPEEVLFEQLDPGEKILLRNPGMSS